MIIVKQPGPPERLRLPPVQPPHADAPAPVSPQPLRTSPASPCSAAASLAGLWCRRRRRRRHGRGLAAPSACAHPGRAGAGWRESRLFRSGAAGPGGLFPSLLPACPLGSRPQGPLQREGRAWWPDPGSTSYLVDFPVPFSPGQHASFAGRKPKDPESPNVLKGSLEKRKKPFTFQDGNVTLFEYDFSFFTCRNMQVEAFQAMRKLCRG